ncbi:MAG: hypothetical protein QOC66_723 [Pseudonocardiales bacterium]|jgi:hypothetical protein|nr:hypothetical protein [Pseudonocardiales bacterium]
MRKLNPYALRVTALTAAAAFALMPMAAASAATANASAYGARVSLLSGITIGPLAPSTFPPTSNSAVVPLNLVGLAHVLGVYSKTSGDLQASTSHAEAGTADLGLIGFTATGFAISANAISATCDASGTTTSGGTTVANLKLGSNDVINLTSAQQQNVVVIPNVASVIIGEQIHNPDGSLTVNALHVTLLGSTLGDVILGHVVCGPNVPQAGVAAFSFQDLPLILGALALVIVIGFGIRTGVRRLRTAA